MAPLPAAGLEACVTVAIMVIVGHGIDVTEKDCEPVHPAASFAVTEYVPTARLLKMPDAWNAPPFKLKVKLVLPVAVAFIAPLVAVDVEANVIVPVTVIVFPAQGFEGGGGVTLLLLQPV